MIYMQEIEIAPRNINKLQHEEVVGLCLRVFDTIEERNNYVKNFVAVGENMTVFKDIEVGQKLVFAIL